MARFSLDIAIPPESRLIAEARSAEWNTLTEGVWDLLADDVIEQAALTAKLNPADADDAAGALQLVIDAVRTQAGVIIVDVEDPTIRFLQFDLTPAQSTILAGARHHVDLQLWVTRLGVTYQRTILGAGSSIEPAKVPRTTLITGAGSLLDPPPIDHITVSPAVISKVEGETHQFVATAWADAGETTSLYGVAFVWSVQDAARGDVTQTGFFTAEDAGAATQVRATVGADVGFSTVTVTPAFLLRYVPGDSLAAYGGVHSRSSSATYVDVNGVIQTAAVDVLRDAHYRGAVRTALVEPQGSTNTFLHSATPANAYWDVGDMVKSVSPVVAPDGGAATRITQSGGNNNVINATVAATPDSWCDSIYIRAVPGTGAQWVKMRSQRSDLSQMSVSFDVLNGVIGSNDGLIAFIRPYVVGGVTWYRIGVKDAAGGLTHISIYNIKLVHADGGEPGAGDSTRAWDIWGGQSEPGLAWSSFIYTTTASVARAADFLTFDWGHAPATLFSMLMDHYEIGGRYQNAEGARWGLGQVYALPHIMANNIGANYGHSYHVDAGGAGNLMAGAHAALGTRVEIRLQFGALNAVAEMALDGGAPVGGIDQGHSGPPDTWGADGVRIGRDPSGGRTHPMELRKIIFMEGNKTFAELRAG